ncbi:MAG TPA: methyltransferase domain-containing protein [Thermoanaerobaculia bacterium]|nr:methyltransferase domain-containing protein [Thermoanaerobaculia bacterium]
MSDFDAATRYWDREVLGLSYVHWMANSEVRAYINACINGTPHLWPMDFLETVTNKRHFTRALSIGCGSGAMERDLMKRGLCDSVDALDGSIHSLHLAVTAARAEGFGDAIRYFASDFNRPVLPHGKYDLVIFQQSMHHVGKLEKLLRNVLLALKPDGLMYIDEYVGPSRHEWTEAHITAQRAAFHMLPRELRLYDELALPIQIEDPSEGIRSGEILEQLAVGFEIVDQRDYGGNWLSIAFPVINWSNADPGLASRLIESERAMLRSGLKPWMKVAVLKPKRGAAKRAALLKYFVVPKAKRIVFELKRMT